MCAPRRVRSLWCLRTRSSLANARPKIGGRAGAESARPSRGYRHGHTLATPAHACAGLSAPAHCARARLGALPLALRATGKRLPFEARAKVTNRSCVGSEATPAA